MHGDPGFLQLLDRFQLDQLTAHESTVFGLWPDLRLACFNDAWYRFAEANGGQPAISGRFGLGVSLLDAIQGPLRPLYAQAYARCLSSMTPWEHLYECSSFQRFRRFQMTVYPLRDRSGLLTVHSLRVERPHDASRPSSAELPVDWQAYVSPHGSILQCSHCRRVQHYAQPQRWDWIGQWVAHPPGGTSHGLCPPCLDYYYQECTGESPLLN